MNRLLHAAARGALLVMAVAEIVWSLV